MKTLALLLGCLVFYSMAGAATVIDLGMLPGDTQAVATAINDADQVTGTTSSADFLWENGRMTNITAPFNAYCSSGINNSGQIAGGAADQNGIFCPAIQDVHATRRTAVTVLGSFGGVIDGSFNGSAAAINNTGQACGFSYINSVHAHAFLYDGGVMRDIGLFIHDYSAAAALNDNGDVVGVSGANGFLYTNGTLQYLIPFGSTQSQACAINNKGQIAGYYLDVHATATHSYLYENGTFTDISAADSHETDAMAINDAGQVVGQSWPPPDRSCRRCIPEPRAFVYENGALTELNTLLPAGSPWRLAYAYAINSKGHIAGGGYVNGQLHAFMLIR